MSVDDYRVATALLESVGRFVKAQRALFESAPEERVSTSSRIAMPGGDVEVTVTAPPAELPWRWGEEEPFEGLRRRDREELVSAFRSAREAEGAARSEADADASAAEEMLAFKQGKGGSLLDTLGMKDGDVMKSINGFDMSDPQKALEAYARLRSADRLTVAMERGGAPVNIDINIR